MGSEHETKVSTLVSEHERAFSLLRKQHAEDITILENDSSTSLAALRSQHRLEIANKDERISKLLEELSQSEIDCAEFKRQISILELHIIEMEQEIYEMETTQLDLVN